MIIVESNHMRVLRRPSLLGEQLTAKLLASHEDVCTTIITVHEAVNGCLSEINKSGAPHAKVVPYEHLRQIFVYFCDWNVLPFDASAADEFVRLKQIKEIRNLGTMDLQIAAISISNKALLLSSDAHFKDIAEHSTLIVEDWLVDKLEK